MLIFKEKTILVISLFLWGHYASEKLQGPRLKQAENCVFFASIKFSGVI